MIGVEQQLDFIRYLQEWRGPFFDSFLRILNFFDSAQYVSLLNAFIWLGISWRWGARVSYLMILNGLLIFLGKNFFEVPRPFCWDPSLALVHAGGYSFPSGAAQTSFLMGGLLLYACKGRWIWSLSAFYVLLISLSRVFLGVHYPIDLLGGWFVGGVLLVGFILSHRFIERIAEKNPEKTLVVALALFSSLTFLVHPRQLYLPLVGIALSVGIYFSTKHDLYIRKKRGWPKRFIHGWISVFGSLVLGLILSRFGLKAWEGLITFAVIGTIWVSLLASPICEKITD